MATCASCPICALVLWWRAGGSRKSGSRLQGRPLPTYEEAIRGLGIKWVARESLPTWAAELARGLGVEANQARLAAFRKVLIESETVAAGARHP
jgi:hypothetical protein